MLVHIGGCCVGAGTTKRHTLIVNFKGTICLTQSTNDRRQALFTRKTRITVQYLSVKETLISPDPGAVSGLILMVDSKNKQISCEILV